MLKTLLFTLIVVAAAVVLLSLRLLLKNDARGPMQHIGASKAMRERDIGCVESMDARERYERAYRPHASEKNRA